jgi:hypothetical protein
MRSAKAGTLRPGVIKATELLRPTSSVTGTHYLSGRAGGLRYSVVENQRQVAGRGDPPFALGPSLKFVDFRFHHDLSVA